jgi:hypothetical protein
MNKSNTGTGGEYSTQRNPDSSRKYNVEKDAGTGTCPGDSGYLNTPGAWYGCTENYIEKVTNTVDVGKGEQSSVLFVMAESRYDPSVRPGFAVIEIGGRIASDVDILQDGVMAYKLKPYTFQANVKVPKGTNPVLNWKVMGASSADTVLRRAVTYNESNSATYGKSITTNFNTDPSNTDGQTNTDCRKYGPGFPQTEGGLDIIPDNDHISDGAKNNELNWTSYQCTVKLFIAQADISPILSVIATLDFDSSAQDMTSVQVAGNGTVAYDIIPSPITLKVGAQQEFTGLLRADVAQGIIGKEVVWHVIGNNDPNTTIETLPPDENGNLKGHLTVSPNETSPALMILVQSVEDKEYIGYAQVTLSGIKTMSIRITDTDLSITPNSTQTMHAEFKTGPEVDRSMEWILSGNTSAQTTITPRPGESNADIHIGTDEASQSLFVIARSKIDETVFDYATVKVNANLGILGISVKVNPNLTEVDLNDTSRTATSASPLTLTPTVVTSSVDSGKTPPKTVKWEMLNGTSKTGFKVGGNIVSSVDNCAADITNSNQTTNPAQFVLDENETNDNVYIKATACHLSNQSNLAPVFDIATVHVRNIQSTGLILSSVTPDTSGYESTNQGEVSTSANLSTCRVDYCTIDIDGVLSLPNFVTSESGYNQLNWKLIGSTSAPDKPTKIESTATGSENKGIFKARLSISPNEASQFFWVEACSAYIPSLCAKIRVNLTKKANSGIKIYPDRTTIQLQGADKWALGGWTGAEDQRSVVMTPSITVPVGKTANDVAKYGAKWEIISGTSETYLRKVGQSKPAERDTACNQAIGDSDANARTTLNTCVLVVGENETDSAISVKITSLYDPTLYDVIVVYVSGQMTSGLRLDLNIFDGSGQVTPGNAMAPCDEDAEIIGSDVCANTTDTKLEGASLSLPAGSDTYFKADLSVSEDYPDRTVVFSVLGGVAGSNSSVDYSTNFGNTCYSSTPLSDIQCDGSAHTPDNTANFAYAKLHIDVNEINTPLIVKACLRQDLSKCSSVLVTVFKRTVSGVTIDPSTVSIAAGGHLVLNASTFVTAGNHTDLIWEIAGEEGATTIHNTGQPDVPCSPLSYKKGDTSGTYPKDQLSATDERNEQTHDCQIDIATDESAFVIFVTARLADVPNRSFTTTIYVTNRATSEISMTPMRTEVKPGHTQKYQSHVSETVTGASSSANKQEQVNWTLTGNIQHGTYISKMPEGQDTEESKVAGCNQTSVCYLHVAPNQVKTTLYVTASSTSNTSRKVMGQVDIIDVTTSGLTMCSARYLNSVNNKTVKKDYPDYYSDYYTEPPDDIAEALETSECPSSENVDAGESETFEFDVSNRDNKYYPELSYDFRVRCEVIGSVKGTSITATDKVEDIEVLQADDSMKTFEKQTSTCKLNVSKDEIATQLYIVAYSLADPMKRTRFTVDITKRNTKGVIISPTTIDVDAGKDFQFTTYVSVPKGETEEVTYSLRGQSKDTTIDESGLLHVAKDENANYINVIVTSKFDPSRSDLAIVGVKNKTSSGIEVSPQEAEVAAGSGLGFSAHVTVPVETKPGKTEDEKKGIRWSVMGGMSMSKENDKNPNAANETKLQSRTQIDPSSGSLTVDAREKSTSLVVIARSTYDDTIIGTSTVKVTNIVEPDVKITEPNIVVPLGQSHQFATEVTVPAGESKAVKWDLQGDKYAPGTRIDPDNGTLSVDPNEPNFAILIRATLQYDKLYEAYATVFTYEDIHKVETSDFTTGLVSNKNPNFYKPVYVKYSQSPLTFMSGRDAANFSGVEIDGHEVSSAAIKANQVSESHLFGQGVSPVAYAGFNDYDSVDFDYGELSSDGQTYYSVVQAMPEYLDTLSNGEHTIKIKFEGIADDGNMYDGNVPVKFDILEGTQGVNIFDPQFPWLAVILGIIAFLLAAGASVFFTLRQRKKRKALMSALGSSSMSPLGSSRGSTTGGGV